MKEINEDLNALLENWVLEKEKNGIKQHGKKWHEAKVYTIGGSSIATIQGKNPYNTICELVREKIGMSKRTNDIKPQWGNLFEDVIKRYVEHDRKCKILGEDLFIKDIEYTSYSPDGLAVFDVIRQDVYEEEIITDTKKSIQMIITENTKREIVLIEFKCPFSRIPNGIVPDYYIPQVKMGLDLLKFPTTGVFIEAVFRRCTWPQLENNSLYDKTLVPRSSGKDPLAIGLIGFYYDDNKYQNRLGKLLIDTEINAIEEQKKKLWLEYDEYFIEKGDNTNNYLANDLGEAPPELFKVIMDCYDKKILSPVYYSIVFIDNYKSNIVDDDMEKHIKYCSDNNFINFGILPWKLFRIDYNIVERDENYIRPWLPKIKEIVDVVRECNDPLNADKKEQIYLEFEKKNITEKKPFRQFKKKEMVGFSDE